MHSIARDVRTSDRTAQRCGYCGRRLSDRGSSLDFCDVTCQEQWYAARADRLPDGHGTLVRPALRAGWS